jgi:NO-binding membrane sensor protein with MHYT domain
VAEIHHFTYGFSTALAALLAGFIGSLVGLACTRRARAARTRGRSTRWLVLAAAAIGGVGVWLMNCVAIMGFDIPDSTVRLDPAVTFASLLVAVLPVYLGLFFVARVRRFALRLSGGAFFTGLGVVAMHYGGMYAFQVTGDVTYEPRLAGASAAVAVLGAAAALCLLMLTKGWWSTVLAAAILGATACGAHYLGMAALRIRPTEAVDGPLEGVGPFQLIVPIMLLTSLALIGTAFSALQAMTEEEFDGAPPRRGGAHAEVPWQLADGLGAARATFGASAEAPSRPAAYAPPATLAPPPEAPAAATRLGAAAPFESAPVAALPAAGRPAA